MDRLELCDALAMEVLGYEDCDGWWGQRVEGTTNQWTMCPLRATELYHNYPKYFRPDQHIKHLFPVWKITGKPVTTFKAGKICMELRHKEFLVSDKQPFSLEEPSNIMSGDICLTYWRTLQKISGASVA